MTRRSRINLRIASPRSDCSIRVIQSLMPQLMLAVLSFAFIASISAAPKDTLPSCPPDWKIEVIAEAPKLIHPSAVCVAPDGRVFVGQDPMDMANPSDQP